MAFTNAWQRPRNGSDPFTDLLFNALLGFTYLFLIAIMFMNPVAKKGIIDPKAEYIITIGWPDNNCLLYTSPSPRDAHESRMPSSA